MRASLKTGSIRLGVNCLNVRYHLVVEMMLGKLEGMIETIVERKMIRRKLTTTTTPLLAFRPGWFHQEDLLLHRLHFHHRKDPAWKSCFQILQIYVCHLHLTSCNARGLGSRGERSLKWQHLQSFLKQHNSFLSSISSLGSSTKSTDA